MLPEEGGQQVDPTNLDDSLDGESNTVAYGSHVAESEIDETMASSDDSSEAAMEGDEDPLDGNDKWVCWFCHEDDDHKDGGECPDEDCYHGKHPHKDKAKHKARKACEKEHEYGCYFKRCKKRH